MLPTAACYQGQERKSREKGGHSTFLEKHPGRMLILQKRELAEG